MMGKNTQNSYSIFANCLLMEEGDTFAIMTPNGVRIFELIDIHVPPFDKTETQGVGVIYDELIRRE